MASILIVDDQADIRRVLTRLVRIAGKADPVIVADVIGRTQHGETPFILVDDGVAPHGAHYPVSAPHAGVGGEQVGHCFKVMIVDRKAIACRQRPDRAFGFHPAEPVGKIFHRHYATMAARHRTVQPFGKGRL